MYIDAYKRANLATEHPSKTEYRLFAEITGELEASGKEGAFPQSRVNALFRNSQLWLALEADLVSPENKMEKELKAGLISLAIWAKKFTSTAMRSKIDLEPLITVNRQIMSGLLEAERNSRTPAMMDQTTEFSQVQA